MPPIHASLPTANMRLQHPAQQSRQIAAAVLPMETSHRSANCRTSQLKSSGERSNGTTVLKEVAQLVKDLPAMRETRVQSQDWEDPLEEGMTTHFILLAWRIQARQRSLAGYSTRGHKELDTTEQLSPHTIKKKLEKGPER